MHQNWNMSHTKYGKFEIPYPAPVMWDKMPAEVPSTAVYVAPTTATELWLQ